MNNYEGALRSGTKRLHNGKSTREDTSKRLVFSLSSPSSCCFQLFLVSSCSSRSSVESDPVSNAFLRTVFPPVPPSVLPHARHVSPTHYLTARDPSDAVVWYHGRYRSTPIYAARSTPATKRSKCKRSQCKRSQCKRSQSDPKLKCHVDHSSSSLPAHHHDRPNINKSAHSDDGNDSTVSDGHRHASKNSNDKANSTHLQHEHNTLSSRGSSRRARHFSESEYLDRKAAANSSGYASSDASSGSTSTEKLQDMFYALGVDQSPLSSPPLTASSRRSISARSTHSTTSTTSVNFDSTDGESARRQLRPRYRESSVMNNPHLTRRAQPKRRSNRLKMEPCANCNVHCVPSIYKEQLKFCNGDCYWSFHFSEQQQQNTGGESNNYQSSNDCRINTSTARTTLNAQHHPTINTNHHRRSMKNNATSILSSTLCGAGASEQKHRRY